MSSTPKRLVVELKSSREKVCQITGTRESLRLLAEELAEAAATAPEQEAVPYLPMPGWEQHTFEDWEGGFFFRIEPDLDAYIKQKHRTRDRFTPWIAGTLAFILFALILIGLSTVWRWLFE